MAARNSPIDSLSAAARPAPMDRARIIPWLVQFSRIDAASLASGRPGDLPNLIYELRQWLDLESDEPLSADVDRLQRHPARLQALIDAVRALVEAVADRQRFQTSYGGGTVILDARRLGSEGGRALSYRDARLTDAALRVAIDDIYENTQAALRISRCVQPE